MSVLNGFTIFFLVFSFIKHATASKAVAYYCDFGFCENEQYCCGDNKCCDKLLDLWYFWVGVGIVVVVVAVVIFLKYYLKKPKSHVSSYKYKLLDEPH